MRSVSLAALVAGAFGGDCTGASSDISAKSCAAWQDLYRAWGGSTWKQCSDSYNDPCGCGGSSHVPGSAYVECFGVAAERDITKIIMQNNSLYGSTPSSLGDLPFLTQLVLNWNFLEGNLPVNQLAQMKGLNSVQLGGNQFTGTIPAAFGEQTQLELFVVNNNQLEGTVPEALCDLELLTYMQFRHNKTDRHAAVLHR